jgi:hypothetical protein
LTGPVPSFPEHHRRTVDFLGWDMPEVHRTIDAAAGYLGGRHRVVGHNRKMARAIEDLFGRRGLTVFTCHVLQDAGILREGRYWAAVAEADKIIADLAQLRERFLELGCRVGR